MPNSVGVAITHILVKFSESMRQLPRRVSPFH